MSNELVDSSRISILKTKMENLTSQSLDPKTKNTQENSQPKNKPEIFATPPRILFQILCNIPFSLLLMASLSYQT